MVTIYHMATESDWRAAEAEGAYTGGAVDRKDGFIHFSTAEHIAESAARHRAGERSLLLVAVDADALGDDLKWEESRGGVAFPHLYGALRLGDALWVKPLPLGPDGFHVFPSPWPPLD
jgi:uncharacterized protein (DUF952 family)